MITYIKEALLLITNTRDTRFCNGTPNSVFSNVILHGLEAVACRCSVKKVFLKILQNSQENTCTRVSSKAATLLKKTLEQVFFSEFSEIFKNTLFYRTPNIASHKYKPHWWVLVQKNFFQNPQVHKHLPTTSKYKLTFK